MYALKLVRYSTRDKELPTAGEVRAAQLKFQELVGGSGTYGDLSSYVVRTNPDDKPFVLIPLIGEWPIEAFLKSDRYDRSRKLSHVKESGYVTKYEILEVAE